ncbi:T9SS type A sorting domain-containing protein, partial [Bacteroidales bacterium OttesenSCG-928-K03]|nr:T9SS type A sorting domain-containing protein [Bacteroidales bacterium OttesenSCG-928-K03]
PDDYDYVEETQYFCGSAVVSDISTTAYGLTWYSDEDLTVELNLDDELTHGATYYAASTNGDCAIIGYAVTVNIYNLLPPTVKTPVELCSTDEVLTLVDIYVYGITSGASINWYESATSDVVLPLTTVLENGDIFWVSQNIGECESERSYITVEIIEQEQIAAPIIPAQSFCDTQDFTLEDINLPDGMTVAWYADAEGGVELVPGDVVLEDNDIYYAALVAGYCQSTERTPVEITITPYITITPVMPTPQYFCEGAMISNVNHGEHNPNTITWYTHPTDDITLNVSEILTSGTYYAAITLSDDCESQERLAVEIFIDPEMYDYETGTQDFCYGATVANITVMGYGITWYSDEELTEELDLGELLTHGATYYAANTSGDCAIIGYAVTATVYENLNPPTVSSPIVLCSTDDELTLANVYVQGLNITWYESEISTEPLLPTTVLEDGATYWVSQRIGDCESERSYINVVINDELEVPAPEITTPQYFCETGTYHLSDIVLAPGMNVVWYNALEDGEILPLDTELADGTVYYAALMIGYCESTERTAVEVIFTDEEKIELIIEDQPFCDGAVIANIVVPYTGISWYYNIDDVQELPYTTRLITHTYYAEINVNEDCTVTERVPVNITVGLPEEVITPSEQFFCIGANIENLEVTGFGVSWFATDTATVPLPVTTPLVHGATYYAANVNGDCESTRVAVTVYLYENVNPPTLESPIEMCVSNNPGLTLADVKVIQGVNITWYDAETAGNELPLDTELTDGGIYWASQTVGGCESLRSFVKVTFNPEMEVPAPVIPSPLRLCNSGNILVGDLPSFGYDLVWYNSEMHQLFATDIITTGIYYVSQVVGECESTERAQVSIMLTTIFELTINVDPQDFCEGAILSDIIVDEDEDNYEWYLTPTGGEPLPMNTILETRSYYIGMKVGDCESSTRTEVPVTIGEPSLVITETSQEFCGSATIADLYVLGYGVKWYDAEDATVPLPVTTELVNGATYYVANSNGDCEGERTEVTVAIYPIPTPPVLGDDALAEVCDGDEISVDFIVGLIDVQANVDYVIYVDEDCTTEFTTAFNSDYSVATSHLFYVMAYYTGTTCGHDTNDALEIAITVNPRPEAPIIITGADLSVCDGETIDEDLLYSLIEYDDTEVTVAFYLDEECTTAFDEITTDYSVATSHTIYVTAITTATGCETFAVDALELVITVDPRPEAPILIDGSDLSVCDGETIDKDLLYSLIEYDDETVTVAFYIDEECTTAFTEIITDYSLATSHTIYVTAINIATECETFAEEALELIITVDPRPAAPTIIDGADQSVCDGETIDEDLLYSLIDYDDTEVTVAFYLDEECTIAFAEITTDYSLATSHTIYVTAINIASECETFAEEALELIITVDPRPETPILVDDAMLTLCEGTPIDITLLTSLIVEQPFINLRFYQDIDCTIRYLGDSIAKYEYSPYTFYAIASDTTSGCLTLAEYALEITITVNQQPVFITCPEVTLQHTTVPGDLSMVVDYIVEVDATMPEPILTYVFAGDTEGSGEGTGSGSTFNVGLTTVTVTASIEGCESVTCVFEIEIIDGNEPPEIDCSEIIELFGDENSMIIVSTDPGLNSYTHPDDSWDATAFDDVVVDSLHVMITNITTGQVLVSYEDGIETLAGYTFYFGYDYEIIWRAVDHAGLYAECDFAVRVIDTEEPCIGCDGGISCETITNQQGIVNICLTALQEVYVHYGINWDVTGTDNIAVASITYELTGATTGSGTTLNGVTFNVGTTTVTWTVIDVNENESTCSFDVVVNTHPTVEVENFIYCDGEEAGEYTFEGEGTFVWQRVVGFDLGLPVNSGVNTIPAFTAINEGFESITAIYQVTPVSGTDCVGTPQYFMITVNPRPITSVVEDMVYCNGVTAPIYNFTSNLPAAYYEWEFVNEAGSTMIPGIPESGDNFIPSFVAYNAGDEPLVGKYRVRASYSFANLTCNDYVWQEFFIVILPTPEIPVVTPVHQEICSGETIEDIVFASNIEEVTFMWTRISGNIPEIPVTGEGDITGMIIENTGYTPIEAIYEVKAVLNYEDYPAYNCESLTTQFSIVVGPKPSTADVSDFVYCSGDIAPLYEFTGNNPMALYEWEYVSGAVISGIPTFGINYFPSFIAVNNGNTPLVSNYRVKANYGNCYEDEWVTFSVIILPVPTVTATPVHQNLCSGEETAAVEFTSNVTDVIYSWVRISGNIPELPIEGEGTFESIVLENTGTVAIEATYEVTPILNYSAYPEYTCAGTPTQFSIAVLPNPYINSIPDMIYCDGELTPGFEFGNASDVIYKWQLIDKDYVGLAESGEGSLPPFIAINKTKNVLEAIYEVSAIYSMYGHECISTTTFNIIVNPLPSVDLNIGPYSFCVGEETQEIDLSVEFESLGNPTGTVYEWMFVSGDYIGLKEGYGTDVVPSFIPENNGVQQVTAIFSVRALYENCVSEEKMFIINVDPKPYVTSSLHAGETCSGERFDYQITTSIPVHVLTWERLPHADINNNEGSIGEGAFISEVLTNTSNTSVTVTYLISALSGSCDFQHIAEIEVIVIPDIDLNLDSRYIVCDVDDVLNIEYDNLGLEEARYKLTFSHEAVMAGFVNVNQYITLPESNIVIDIPQGIALGNYAATLTVELHGCERSYDFIITLKTLPVISSMSETDLYYCENETMELFVETADEVQYQWYHNENILVGETGSTYTSIFDLSKEGMYRVEVSNECGVVEFVFNVSINPIIIERKWNDVLYIDNTGDKYVSYQWYKDGYPVTQYGASQYYTEHGGFTAYSEYNLRAYKADGTYDEACPIIPNDGSDIQSANLIVYPNPSQTGSIVTILLELPSDEEPIADAYIFDVNGKKLYEYKLVSHSTKVRIDVASGTYFLRVYTKSGSELVEKIIVQK